MNEKETLFPEQLKDELSLTSPRDPAQLVTSVLHALRQTLTRQNAESLLMRLPDFFKVYFTRGWTTEEKCVPIVHLDELVTLVMERDRLNERGLFKDEIQALAVILVTLKRLFAVVDPRTVAGISQPLYLELSDAAI